MEAAALLPAVPEEAGAGGLFEWNFDLAHDFRSGINRSMDRIDLTGAFDRCPIPTLILEGKWDLTWNSDKPGVIAGNHPGARLVLFENAGHGIYDEDTEAFFADLYDFLTHPPQVKPADEALSVFKKMAGFAGKAKNTEYKALATVWEGHMCSIFLAAGTKRSGSTSMCRPQYPGDLGARPIRLQDPALALCKGKTDEALHPDREQA